ncbi:porin family protein [Flavobacterium cerinum]|uniref:PorT family protein n=1 Tax=Flavobacterium cerinum TaxID=2502784 RepID=A0A3S3QNK4_9FLAO|nr:porin family protein [Flavobacterium cerinum]RWW93755.1 PorT family protein [Flavobacterium cerinum]
MKRITLLFICFLALQANAQVTVKPGVRAGLNLTSFTNTNDTHFKNRTDFYVGGYVAVKLASFYTLQPEITYSRQGAKARVYDFSFDPVSEKSFSLQYLSLGVMNKFTFGPGFHGLVGPTADIKVGDNFTGYEGDELTGLDLGLMTGVGYTLPMGLTIEARYKLGLLDIFGNSTDDDYDSDELILNSVFQLGLAYTF